jgi:hypothetical protein
VTQTQDALREIGDGAGVTEIIRSVVNQQTGRYNSFLTQFATGFQNTSLQMYKWLLYPVLTANPVALETGLTYRTMREQLRRHHPEGPGAQLKHVATNTVAQIASPHRPLTPSEIARRQQLTIYLGKCSEDELIEDVLLPLFRQLGFHRVTAAGHKDKALEYGKDIWMKYTLPTLHVLYFGIQAKKGKLDSSGVSKSGSTSISEILNQVTMMLGHEVLTLKSAGVCLSTTPLSLLAVK